MKRRLFMAAELDDATRGAPFATTFAIERRASLAVRALLAAILIVAGFLTAPPIAPLPRRRGMQA